ncbi:MAG: adenosyl-hopene transferase HpnH [Planctomycetota bacterium]|nr:adenosyl-hopene transferase HpnH [Planctomycetota bacterium]
MSIPFKQAVRVGAYVMKHRLLRTKRFPMVLMLEPLFRCNLACAGCGKIQYPEHILNKRLSPEECWEAAEECGAPVVSIAGGEPLIHPEIKQIVDGLVQRKKFVYLCTNAVPLKKKLDEFQPSPYMTFSIHIDGLRERHDEVVCEEGVFDKAVEAIRAAKARGFRVTTNTTVFDGEDPSELRKMFDFLQDLDVDGMMISPGYSYDKAPDQDHFLKREQTKSLFRQILKDRQKWSFNHSPQFLDFLEGKKEYECTPWGNPTRNVFGWQKPCYLLQDGYADSFSELIDDTDWDAYGRKSGNPKCQDCMVHCGYEASAVLDATSGPREMLRSAVGLLRQPGAKKPSATPV